MKRSRESTHAFRGPTPAVKGCDLTPPTRTQTSEQECSDLLAINRRPSTLYSSNIPAFIENLVESENLVCSDRAGMKTALGIIHPWFIYFKASSQKALGVHLSREAKERDAPVFSAFSPASLLMYRDDPSRTPGYMTRTSRVSQRTP